MEKDIIATKSALKTVLDASIRVASRAREDNKEKDWFIEWQLKEPCGDVDCLKEKSKDESLLADTAYRYASSFFSFEFIHVYVTTSYFDEETIRTVLNEYIDRLIEDAAVSDKTFEKLDATWWSISETEFDTLIQEVKTHFLNNEYPVHTCLNIINSLLSFQASFDKNLKDDIDQLVNYLEQLVRDGKAHNAEHDDLARLMWRIDVRPENKAEFNGYVSRIKSAAKVKSDDDIVAVLNNFSNTQWPQNILDFLHVYQKKQAFLEMKTILARLDLDQAIGNLQNEKWYTFGTILNLIYRGGYINYFRDDYDALKELSHKLSTLTVKDKLEVWRRKRVLSVVDEIIKQMDALNESGIQ
jgi:hypothetical protein